MLEYHYFKLQYPYVYTVEKSINMKQSLENLGYVNLKLRYDIRYFQSDERRIMLTELLLNAPKK